MKDYQYHIFAPYHARLTSARRFDIGSLDTYYQTVE